MRVFKTRAFSRFASKEGIEDGDLYEKVGWLESGRAEAKLGGNVYKIRVARPGEGKSGGYRVVVAFKSAYGTFYMHGFEKSAVDNISQKELMWLKKQAKSYLALSDDQIAHSLRIGELEEIRREP